MSVERFHRPAAVLAFAVLALWGWALVAPAAHADPVASPGTRIADALRKSPVYVDAAYAGAVPAPRRAELVRRVERSGLPIKVVLTPLVKGDAFDGDSATLADVVHDRLGQRDLIVITMASFDDGLAGREWPDDRHQAQEAVGAVYFLDSMKNAGLAARVDKAIDLVAAGDGRKVYQEATADLSASPSAPHTAAPRGGGGVPWLVLAAAVAAVVLAASASWLVVRRRRTARTAPFAFPKAVFAAAREADEAQVRREAESEVLALGEALDGAEIAKAGEEAVRLALDAYAAAGTVLDGARDLPDLAGVLTLVAAGRDALEGRAGALPLCFFDPLHGRSQQRLSWRPLGRQQSLDVAACARCVREVRARRTPEVLTAQLPDGSSVPYFEVPAEQSLWAATGYGSLVDGVAEVARRVVRGDFTRQRAG
ncbi:hypothetical protein ACFV3R_32235 [Streptomyces sp. NPDC059740]|uniref:hypothetical protein n=1 Tax=Streptomyces sp. NPDC059740 TaxID=3346926 RepID=UPI0036509BC9